LALPGIALLALSPVFPAAFAPLGLAGALLLLIGFFDKSPIPFRTPMAID
jgi:hypothetical protein